MDARRIRSVSAAGLLVVVVGVAAATLETPRGGSDGGATHAQRGDVIAGGTPIATPEVPFVGVALALAAVVLAVGIVRYRREFLVGVAGAATGLGVLVGIYVVLAESGDTDPPPEVYESGESLLRSASVAATTPGGAEGPTTSSPVGLLLVGVVLVVGFVALIAYWGEAADRLATLAAGGDEEPDESLTAVGRSAGRAADRLEAADADVSNEVYRAWDEMTAHLDVQEGAARTPGELRTEALRMGMAREDVDALTGLFEEVRYGGAAPTGEREHDAVAALRRIESAYAAEGAT